MSATLNLTEVLSSLQDYITIDGAIATEHRAFYVALRGQLDTHPGTFLPTDIQILMEMARREMSGEVSDEEFAGFIESVMSKISVKERLEIKTLEDAETRSQEDIAAMVKEAEDQARAKVEAEYRLKASAEAHAKTQQQTTPVQSTNPEEVETLLKERAEAAAEEARQLAEKASIKAEADAREELRKGEHEKAMAEIEGARKAAEEEMARLKAETNAQIAAVETERIRLEQEAAERAAEDEARRQAEIELEEAKKQAEVELEEARRQAEVELEEAKKKAQAELEAAQEAAKAAQEALAAEAEAERIRAEQEAATRAAQEEERRQAEAELEAARDAAEAAKESLAAEVERAQSLQQVPEAYDSLPEPIQDDPVEAPIAAEEFDPSSQKDLPDLPPLDGSAPLAPTNGSSGPSMTTILVGTGGVLALGAAAFVFLL